jgi:hypothetical protein
METVLMIAIILTTLVLSVALGVVLIAGFVNIISRFIARDTALTPTKPSV